MKLTMHIHLGPRIVMSGNIPLFPLDDYIFMACKELIAFFILFDLFLDCLSEDQTSSFG